MRVLITGADGFVGSNVLRYLLDKTDWDFTAICSWRHKGNPLNMPRDERVDVITHDLTGPIPELGLFDYILHLASESHVDRSQKDPLNFIENNVSSTLQVFEYARAHPPKRLLHFSTDEVYGAHDHQDWDVLLPTNPYAASKAAQEMIAIAYYNTYKLPIIITNSNNIVGPNQDPEKFVPKIAGIMRNGGAIELHTSNGQYGKRFYNPVENVGSAIKFILELPYKNEQFKPDRYSIPGGEQLNNLEMAQLVAEILGVSLNYVSTDVSDIRPGYDAFYAEGDDTLSPLGWNPETTLRDGLSWLRNDR